MKEIDFYQFCPKCKNKLEQKSIQLLFCESCNRNLYLSPKPCVTAIIRRNGKILFSQRAREPYKGQWDLPGGFVDYTDNLEEALARELKEELGVELVSAKYIESRSGVYNWEGYTQVVLPTFFECRISGEPKPSDDVAAIEWHDPKDYKIICFIHDQEVIKKYYLNN